ncbi:hypothetical protein GCM10017784_34740 [Deinococcus indicus]|uniref:hypothetical protein n=1 Tax=Deinococcus indicus TaxID=223556 RepID=UPI0017489A54|nr:hypothetical protein [Deinococcus indicus]GHG37443.1 hypothetical protein GCM10017784_34740 [Deinococcus indicus]
MATIEELNRTWHQDLDGLNADMWARMQALGVTAEWSDPLEGRASPFIESMDGSPYRQVPSDEFYEFAVSYQGEVLASGTRHRVPAGTHALTMVTQAARTLEARGERIIY